MFDKKSIRLREVQLKILERLMERLEKADMSFLTGKWPPDKSRHSIVFIHDVGVSGLSWIHQIKDIGDYANVIVPDLPGHGKSRGTGIDNIPDYAKKIAEFVDALEPDKYIIAGTGMGGAIAQQLLLDYSWKLYGGILMNTGAKLKVLPAILEAVKRDFKAFLTGMSDIIFPAGSEIKNMESAMRDIIKIKQSVMLGDFYACDKFDLRKRLHEINLPVLVISSGNDFMTPVRYGEYLAENIENSKLITIESAGHLSPFEKPGDVNAAILDFINNIAQ